MCGRSFTTKTGLGVHKRRAHPVETNESAAPAQAKRRWRSEEVELMASTEARLLRTTGRCGNMELLQDERVALMGRSLEAVKGKRRSKEYKQLVEQFLEASGSSCALPSTTAEVGALSAIAEEVQPDSDDTEDGSPAASESPIIVVCTDGDEIVESLLREAQKRTESNAGSNAKSKRRKNYILSKRVSEKPLTSRQRRRNEYARVQTLFKKCRSRAVKEIINGDFGSVRHSLEDLVSHWRPVFEGVSGAPGPSSDALEKLCKTVDRAASADFSLLEAPITSDEVKASRVHPHSAAGPDGIRASDWNKVSVEIMARLFTCWLHNGEIPERLRRCRTIFVPKKDSPEGPGDYRPISIASVPLRHFHTILAKRLLACCPPDTRQRGFICADGTLENSAVLDAVLGDSRKYLRECHVAVLDFAKAFDTLSHAALIELLRSRGLPVRFCNYIERLYETASTTFAVDGKSSDPVVVGKGVRQGDPLSPTLFNMAMDLVLANLPKEVGYRLEKEKISALAYADDLILLAGSKAGMQTSINAVEKYGQMMGLRLNHAKSSVLSMVPDGKRKKVHYLADRSFKIGKRWLKQVSCVERWRYLGVEFQASGSSMIEQDIKKALNNIQRAPLKPQQRLEIIRGHLIPSFLHGLVLGNIKAERLHTLDLQIRASVRKWLRLPADVPVAYFHASIKDGGLSIPSLKTCVPDLVLRRFGRLHNSGSQVVRAAAGSERIRKKLKWAATQFAKYSKEDPEFGNMKTVRCYWREGLHSSVDGFELRESTKCPASTKWIGALSHTITGRDYMQMIRTHINALPSRIRSTRGRRNNEAALNCRAGCMVRETTAHCIQQCHRTHGGRIQRHNAVAKHISKKLLEMGWTVEEEPRIHTESGLRKPDIVACKNGEGVIVDVQVVSGQRPLDLAHTEKRTKYGNHGELVVKVAGKLGISVSNVRATSCTVSWRGVWSPGSFKQLKELLGLKEDALNIIPIMVIRGSHMNWSRFNTMTTTTLTLV